jgi:hypothetical protein
VSTLTTRQERRSQHSYGNAHAAVSPRLEYFRL